MGENNYAITEELLDQLLNEYEKPENLLGDDELLHQLTKALVERALEGEMTYHLGYKKHDAAGDNTKLCKNNNNKILIPHQYSER